MSGNVNQLYRDLPQILPDQTAPQNPLIQGAPTWADAAQWHAQNLADTWQAMQNPQTWVDAARQYGDAMLMGTTAPGESRHLRPPYDITAKSIRLLKTTRPTWGHWLKFHQISERWRWATPITGFMSPTGARYSTGIRPLIMQTHSGFMIRACRITRQPVQNT